MTNYNVHIPNKFVYHVSLKTNRSSILINGLLPKAFNDSEWTKSGALEYPDAIFVNNQNDYSWWFYIAEGMWHDINIDKYDVWKINTTGTNNTWYIDENMNDKGNYLFTTEPISSSIIELHKLSGVCCMHCKALIEGLSLKNVLVNITNKNKSSVSKRWVHLSCAQEIENYNIIDLEYSMIV